MIQLNNPTVTKIQEIIEQVAGCPDDYDPARAANEIYELCQDNRLCEKCGCNLSVWKEMFGEEHNCVDRQERRTLGNLLTRPLNELIKEV